MPSLNNNMLRRYRLEFLVAKVFYLEMLINSIVKDCELTSMFWIFETQLKQKTLELQISDLKIKQHEEKLIQEQAQMKVYAEQVSQLLATEKNLRLQLTADGEKFQQFQVEFFPCHLSTCFYWQLFSFRLMNRIFCILSACIICLGWLDAGSIS